ncbi:MAG: putative selenate ABC transporter substrate-binding protein [Planctomycetota bacterium]
MRITCLLLAVVFAAGLPACGGESAVAPVLKFTAIPATSTTELAAKFQPLALHLSRELGVTVEYVPTRDYAASVEAFINGDVQLAWFGGLSGVRARRAVAGARAIAQGKVDPEYRSYFIANASAGISPSDTFPTALADKAFAFGSKGSTSGRLMPEHFIRKHTGKSPREFFGKEMFFSGAHDKTAQLVQAGTFDAGAMDYRTYDRMVAEGRIDPAKCVVIWKTPVYPDYNWTAHPDVDEAFGAGTIGRLRAVLIGITDRELLAAVNRPEGLIPAENEEWDALAELAESLGLLR